MITIPKEISQHALAAGELNGYTAEASTLGLPVGQWPSTLLFADMIGNGQPFYRTGYISRHGDLEAVDYKQHLGCITLRVFND